MLITCGHACAITDLFRCPGSVFCDERIAITGEPVQDLQIFASSYIPKGYADVPYEAWPFKAFDRGVVEKRTELFLRQSRELTQGQCFEASRELKSGLTR